MWWMCASLLLVLAIAALYNALAVRKYEIKTDKIKNRIRLVQVSDLHSIYRGKNHSMLIEKIDRQNPDAVVLTGDIFDHAKATEAGEAFLKRISKYQCFYVLGNHEIRLADVEKIVKLAKALGIEVLIDESRKFVCRGEKIVISGINDVYRQAVYGGDDEFKPAMKKAFSSLDETKFNVLLAHNNKYIDEYKKYKFDLVLSGHSHGGQFRIPKIMNGFFIRRQGLFPKYAGGRYEHNNLVHIVSRGVSASPVWCPRIFNRTELVVVDITGK